MMGVQWCRVVNFGHLFSKQANGNNQVQFARGHNIVGKTTFYDMESDQSQKHILTACQDRSVRVYNTSTGKHSKTFKGSTSDDGTLIKVFNLIRRQKQTENNDNFTLCDSSAWTAADFTSPPVVPTKHWPCTTITRVNAWLLCMAIQSL